jgi:hypothetical protein
MQQCGAVAITIFEMSGRSHSVGTFDTTDKVEQIFVSASEAMCVPVDVLQLFLTTDNCPLERCDSELSACGITSDTDLFVTIHMPANIIHDLTSKDYEKRTQMYMKLGALGCAFQAGGINCVTSATLNLLKHILALVADGLLHNKHPLVREAILQALSRLSWCALNLPECVKDMEDMMVVPAPDILHSIAKAFGTVLQSGCWIERQQACAELGLLGGAATSEIELLCVCCLDTNNYTVQVEAYKSLALILESGVDSPSSCLDSVVQVLATGLSVSHPIGEWACRGVSCLGMVATPFVGTLRNWLDQGFDLPMRRAATHAMVRLSEAGVAITD